MRSILLMIILSILSLLLVSCNSGGQAVPDIYNTSTSGQCQAMVTGTKCTISFDYNNHGQYTGLRVSPALPSLEQCTATPTNGCGIIYDGSFDESYNKCATTFNGTSGTGSCNITFVYTAGVSGGETNVELSFYNTYNGASTTPVNVTGD